MAKARLQQRGDPSLLDLYLKRKYPNPQTLNPVLILILRRTGRVRAPYARWWERAKAVSTALRYSITTRISLFFTNDNIFINIHIVISFFYIAQCILVYYIKPSNSLVSYVTKFKHNIIFFTFDVFHYTSL